MRVLQLWLGLVTNTVLRPHGRSCLPGTWTPQRLTSTSPDRIEKAQRPHAVDVRGVLCHFERDLDVRLRAEVVDLRGAGISLEETSRSQDLRDNVHQRGRVGQVTIVQRELALLLDARVAEKMVQARRVEGRRAADNAVDGVALLEKNCGQR